MIPLSNQTVGRSDKDPPHSELPRASPQRRLIPGARDVRFGYRHADRGEFTPLAAHRARTSRASNLLKDVAG